MFVRNTLISFFFILASFTTLASPQASFARLESGDMVFSLFQDSRGMVWAGTQYGLANFNGVSFDHKIFYLPQPAPRDMRVNCSFPEGKETFLVGTSCGLFRLNIRTMHADRIECMEKLDVRCVCPIAGNQYLICSSTGLYVYDTQTHDLKSTEIKAMCYGCVAIDRDSVMVCSYLGAYIYDVKAGALSRLKMLRVRSDGVLSAALDTNRSCAWLGTNGTLYRYDFASGKCSAAALPFNTYKTLLLDSTGALLCGTENGLVIYNPDSGSFRTQRHKARDYSTLTGNVVPGQGSQMWILLTNLGLMSYDASTNASTLFSPEFFSSADPLRNILVQRQSVWVGTLGGLYRLDTDSRQYHYYPMPKMLLRKKTESFG